jgi:hypothetical protein
MHAAFVLTLLHQAFSRAAHVALMAGGAGGGGLASSGPAAAAATRASAATDSHPRPPPHVRGTGSVATMFRRATVALRCRHTVCKIATRPRRGGRRQRGGTAASSYIYASHCPCDFETALGF